MSSEPAIPKGSVVLVTGVNGYIALHIADQLIKAGYKVRGTVRSEEKGKIVVEALTKRHGDKDAISYVVVEDMSSENAFHEAMKGCSGVAHVASDISFRDDPNLVIPPVVTGVKNALNAAASIPTVKRFVLTSSSEALVSVVPDTKYHLDRNSWNDLAVQEAWKTEGVDPAKKNIYVYGASKVEGERAAWKYVEEEKPQFGLNTVCPNFNIGEIIDQRLSASSAGLVKGLWGGDEQAIGFLHMLGPQYAIDVQDVAKLHVAGLTMADVKNERLLGLTEPAGYSRWCESLKKIDPSKSFPPPPENEGKNLCTIDMDRSIEILKRFGQPGLVSLDESVKQLIDSIA